MLYLCLISGNIAKYTVQSFYQHYFWSYLNINNLTVQETKYNYECNYGWKVSPIKIHNTNLEKGAHGNISIYLHIFMPSVQSSLNEAMRNIYVRSVNADENSSAVQSAQWIFKRSILKDLFCHGAWEVMQHSLRKNTVITACTRETK